MKLKSFLQHILYFFIAGHVLLLLSCVQPQLQNVHEAHHLALHYDEELPVSIQLPPSWTIQQGEKKQEITLSNQGKGGHATISAKKVEVNEVSFKLLKTFARITIKGMINEGWVQEGYTDDLLFDGNQAIQYILRRNNEASIVYFLGWAKHIYNVTLHASPSSIAAINDEIYGNIRFTEVPPGEHVQPEDKQLVQSPEQVLQPSPNIFNLKIPSLDLARAEYEKDISNGLELDEKLLLLEQICFKAALYKSEALYLEKKKLQEKILNDTHQLYIHHQDLPSPTRCEALRLYLNNDLTAAVQLLKTLLAKDPGDLHARLYLAMIRPYHSAFLKKNLQEVTAQHPDNILAAYLQSCQKLASGKKRDSYDSLKQSLKKNPTHIWLGFAVARNSFREGNTGVAQRMYNKALELHPSFTPGRYNLAFCLYKDKKYQEAQQHLEQILTTTPSHLDGLLLMGMINKNLENIDAAKTHFEAVLTIAPDNYRALYNIGALCASKLSDTNCARRAFNRYLEVAPQDNRHTSIISWLKRN